MSAFADKRVALVIANSAYQNVPALTNPVNDGVAIANMFQAAGFDSVHLRQNLNGANLRKALRDFSLVARDADIAVVFYAGHGIEVSGTNYIIPIDAKLEQDIDVEDETVSLDRVLATIEPARRLRLIILDACRENPFVRTMKRTVASRSISRGLARVEPMAADTLVAFAAKADSLAMDGTGANSPYTAALLKHLATPGLDVRLSLGRVRDDVLESTGGKQEPFVYGSLGGSDLALVPAATAATAEPASPQVPARSNADERRDYELANQVGTVEAWDWFLKEYTGGFYADLARAQRQKVVAARLAMQGATAPTSNFPAPAPTPAPTPRQPVAANPPPTGPGTTTDSLASLAPAPPARPAISSGPATALPDPIAMARSLQIELKRVGCDPGSADGRWDAGSSHALETFNKHSGTAFDVRVASLDALDAVRAKSSRVCPLECDHNQRVEGDRCVPVAKDTKEPQRAALHQAPHPKHVGGGRCFAFSGHQYCE